MSTRAWYLGKPLWAWGVQPPPQGHGQGHFSAYMSKARTLGPFDPKEPQGLPEKPNTNRKESFAAGTQNMAQNHTLLEHM